MKNYKHIATFTYPSELAIARTVLEANDINCYVRDELTIQVHNFYSNAIGGIRLEVPEIQSENAVKILTASGYEIFLIQDMENSNEVYSKKPTLSKLLKFSIGTVISLSLIFIVVILILFISHG